MHSETRSGVCLEKLPGTGHMPALLILWHTLLTHRLNIPVPERPVTLNIFYFLTFFLSYVSFC